MKSILISIKPRFVAKILNGEKTIEIRKTMPKCDLPIDVYIYCTKDKPYLAHATELITGKYGCISNDEVSYEEHNLNGKVVAKFTLNKVEKIESYLEPEQWYMTNDLGGGGLLEKSCLTFEELDDYLLSGDGYAWHISNLVIFDRPRELGEFKHYNKPSCDSCPYHHYTDLCDYYFYNLCQGIVPLTKAPQSYQFIEVVGDK